MSNEKPRFARFKKPFDTCQIKKHNGTGGLFTIEPENYGIYKEQIDMYEFKEVEGTESKWPYEECRIVYVMPYELLKNHCDIEFISSKWTGCFQDEDQKNNVIRFELRLLKAKTQIDVDVARIYFEAAEINRLEIKASLMRLQHTEKSDI